MSDAIHRSDCAIWNDPPQGCDCHLVDPTVAPPEPSSNAKPYKGIFMSLDDVLRLSTPTHRSGGE